MPMIESVCSQYRLRRSALIIFVICQIILLSAVKLKADTGTEPTSRFRVKYRSIDRIYLDGGKAQGLYEGTILTLDGADSNAVQFEVVYASDNSASCQMISGNADVKQGDWLTVLRWGTAPEVKAQDSVVTDAAAATINAERQAEAKGSTANTGNRTSGSLSLQWYSWQDHTGTNLDFGQTTGRFSLRAQELWGRPLYLRVRSRGQYDQRNRAYSTGAPDNQLVNRLYELSLRYGSDDSPVQLQVGRLLPRQLSRVGYIDGAALDIRQGSGWHSGVMAGAKPRWQFQEEEMSIEKYGLYTGYEHGSFRETYFEEYLAFVGEYHGSYINREFFNIRGRLQSNKGWALSHQIDLDLNRGWRFDKTNSRINLSNVYLSARYRLSSRVTVGGTYDSRQNYWTYEQQTTADSLFDSELRKGFRGNVNLHLPFYFNLNTQLGYRDNGGGNAGTVSYSSYLSKSNIITRQSRLSFRYSGFNGPVNDGYSYALRASQDLSRGVSLGGGYGTYAYKTQSLSQERISRWWESELRLALPYSFFANGHYQRSYGDDLDGHTIQLELGKRF